MKASTLLELGRVSNLPTLWSNVLAGAVLSGGALRAGPLLLVSVAGSAFYVGGMFLNDAFDAPIDARERPERPISSGRASRRQVFTIGFALLAVGLGLLGMGVGLGLSASGFWLLAAGAITALLVVIYDRWHKGYAWSPIVMGLCRAGLYAMGALAVSQHFSGAALEGAVALALYVLGLTHIARFETASTLGRAWPSAFVLAPALLSLSKLGSLPDTGTQLAAVLFAALATGWALYAIQLARRGQSFRIRRAVVALIAGISLADAALMASAGAPGSASFGIAAFIATLVAQRGVRGT